MPVDLVIRDGYVVTPEGVFLGGVAIDRERIVAVGGNANLPAADRTIDAKGQLILPGVVDPHTHPGKRDFEADIRSESQAATTGGVTTMGAIIKSTRMGKYVDVPSGIPSYKEAFPKAKEAVDKSSAVDMYFNFAIVTDEQAQEIPYYAKEFGVTSFKFYLGYMGGDKTTRRAGLGDWCSRLGFPEGFDDGTVFLGFENIGKMGPPCIAHIHAENLAIGRIFYGRVFREGRRDLQAWSERSPGVCEAFHIRAYSYLSKVTNAPLYVVHLNTLEGLGEVLRAKAEGINIIAETCPQYIWISTSDNPPGVWGKSSPPVRERHVAEGLIGALKDGHIFCMGTDHCPNLQDSHMGWDMIPPSSIGVFRGASSSGMQTLLPSMLHYGVRNARLSMEHVVQVCCKNPAYAAGLYPKKGALCVGSDADVIVVDPKLTRKVTPETIHSPYLAFFRERELTGWPTLTLVRGEVVMRDGEVVGKPGHGKYVERKLGHQLYPLT
ncbi:MAG: amidohydrolase family protein [Thaumarchaeota archaeon]|nr:amidohydrolase family protein [Nitrososphaerota archaeon]